MQTEHRDETKPQYRQGNQPGENTLQRIYDFAGQPVSPMVEKVKRNEFPFDLMNFIDISICIEI